jgi:predicted secreted protein
VGKVSEAEAIIRGQTIVTSLNLNAPNKENASYSATFTGKGAFTIG